MLEFKSLKPLLDDVSNHQLLFSENRRKGLRTSELLIVRHQSSKSLPTFENQQQKCLLAMKWGLWRYSHRTWEHIDSGFHLRTWLKRYTLRYPLYRWRPKAWTRCFMQKFPWVLSIFSFFTAFSPTHLSYAFDNWQFFSLCMSIALNKGSRMDSIDFLSLEGSYLSSFLVSLKSNPRD